MFSNNKNKPVTGSKLRQSQTMEEINANDDHYFSNLNYLNSKIPFIISDEPQNPIFQAYTNNKYDFRNFPVQGKTKEKYTINLGEREMKPEDFSGYKSLKERPLFKTYIRSSRVGKMFGWAASDQCAFIEIEYTEVSDIVDDNSVSLERKSVKIAYARRKGSIFSELRDASSYQANIGTETYVNNGQLPTIFDTIKNYQKAHKIYSLLFSNSNTFVRNIASGIGLNKIAELHKPITAGSAANNIDQSELWDEDNRTPVRMQFGDSIDLETKALIPLKKEEPRARLKKLKSNTATRNKEYLQNFNQYKNQIYSKDGVHELGEMTPEKRIEYLTIERKEQVKNIQKTYSEEAKKDAPLWKRESEIARVPHIIDRTPITNKSYEFQKSQYLKNFSLDEWMSIIKRGKSDLRHSIRRDLEDFFECIKDIFEEFGEIINFQEAEKEWWIEQVRNIYTARLPNEIGIGVRTTVKKVLTEYREEIHNLLS